MKLVRLSKKAIIRIFLILLAITIYILIKHNNMYICSTDKVSIVSLGVIDGHLSGRKDNIIEDNINSYQNNNTHTHGDKVLEFVKKYAENQQIYYFDAERYDKISSTSIIDGLEWMKKRGVKNVSISLSSRFYSAELDNWLNDNRNDITVYASYNNLSNSLDYPAMYKRVIGVGANLKNMKQGDWSFKSRKMIVYSKRGISYFNGNSFLAPYVMIKQCLKNNN